MYLAFDRIDIISEIMSFIDQIVNVSEDKKIEFRIKMIGNNIVLKGTTKKNDHDLKIEDMSIDIQQRDNYVLMHKLIHITDVVNDKKMDKEA